MDEFFENLWICPLCSAEHSIPVVTCQRCQCQLLLLNKIKVIGYQLNKAGHSELARRFYEFNG